MCTNVRTGTCIPARTCVPSLQPRGGTVRGSIYPGCVCGEGAGTAVRRGGARQSGTRCTFVKLRVIWIETHKTVSWFHKLSLSHESTLVCKKVAVFIQLLSVLLVLCLFLR